MHILKELSVLFKLTVGVLLIVNLVVRSFKFIRLSAAECWSIQADVHF